jgi:hypothetical protein
MRISGSDVDPFAGKAKVIEIKAVGRSRSSAPSPKFQGDCMCRAPVIRPEGPSRRSVPLCFFKVWQSGDACLPQKQSGDASPTFALSAYWGLPWASRNKRVASKGRTRDWVQRSGELPRVNPGLCFLGHFGPRIGDVQTPSGRMTGATTS